LQLAPAFLLRIFLCSQSGNHSENNLAKFGYVLDMEVEKKKFFYILGYLLEPIIKILEIWIFIFFEI
jgi:hypothetical protein